MEIVLLIAGLVIGILVGIAVTWLTVRSGIDQAVAREKQEAAGAMATLQERCTRIPALEEERDQVSARLEAARQEHAKLQNDMSALQTTLGEERKQSQEKLALLNEAREALTAQFKNLAQEILDEKTKKFTEQNKTNLDTLLKPLSEKIKDFEKKVEETYDKESKQRFSLEREIKQLQELNQKISQDAINLTNALKGQTKTQGNWGELILERVLEKSGLQKGREYEVQVSLTTEEGRRYQPDVIIHLPDERHIVIDSKVSVVAYERYCSTEDEAVRKAELAAHIASLRKHVAELGSKRYQDLYQLTSLDMVLLFVPVEPALTLATQHDQELYNDAFSRGIVLVSPSTLFGILKLIQNVWRQEYQQRNVLVIAQEAGAMFDKFVGFVNDLEEVGKRLKSTQDSYDKAHNKLSSGRGNIVSRAERIRALGAKTSKTLPPAMLDIAGDEDEEQPALPALGADEEEPV